jgi:hypothetical protein
VKVLEAGIVGNLDYKIIEAGRADDLDAWLKGNKYSFAGDEATLDFYVQKRWLFTVMKIDTTQMKRHPDGPATWPPRGPGRGQRAVRFPVPAQTGAKAERLLRPKCYRAKVCGFVRGVS